MSGIKYRKKHNRISSIIWPILFVAILVSSFIGGVPDTGNLYYVVFIINFFLMVFKRKKTEMNIMWFLLFLPLSIYFGQPDPLFKSWQRLGAFSLIMISVSPLIQNESSRRFRSTCLRIVLISSVIIGIISFAFFFLGINYMERYDSTEYIERVGMFGGLTKHSMILGPVASLGAIYCLFQLLTTKKRYYLLFAIPCMGSVLFAASRLAFASMIAGMVVLLLIYSKRKSYFLKVLLMVSAVLFVTYPLFEKGMERIEQKQQNNIESRGKALSSRDLKWEHRLEEFRSSPIYGIGFCSIDTRYVSEYDEGNGGVEPGSSWLAVLSMTGVFGMLLFIGIIVKGVYIALKTKCDESMLRFALLMFFLVHFIGEGYIFSAGGVLCVYAWLVIGCCYDLKYQFGQSNNLR